MNSSKMCPSFNEFIQNTIELNQTDRPVYIVNLDDVVEKVNQWNKMLPNIKPHYALKCCGTPGIVSLLAQSGISFDCASEAEINQILREGLSPKDIIFANPCKTNDMIKFAKKKDVKVMTFDTEMEMVRISKLFPDAQLVIRLKVDGDHSSKYKLNVKFGMDLKEVKPILIKAKELKMNVVGVAFHIGSDSKNPETFHNALQSSRDVFNIAKELGFNEFNILDLGGGFPGDIDFNDPKNLFYRMVEVINKSLNEFFPKHLFPNLQIIAEPGRYFVSSALILLVKVVSVRSCIMENGDRYMMYYLNDGLYGSFLIKFWEPELVQSLRPYLPEAEIEKRPKYKSILFGPTCDSLDVVMETNSYTELHPGDHLYATNFGAYSVPITTPFNGILPPFYQYYSTIESTFNSLLDKNEHFRSAYNTINSYVDLNDNLLKNGQFNLPN